MNIKEQIVKTLDFIKGKTGLTQKQISEEMGYGKTYISTLLQRGGNEVFLKSLEEHYSHLFNDPNVTVNKKVDNVPNLPKPLPGKDDSLSVLMEIAKGNTQIVEGNTLAAESNATVARVNEMIAKRITERENVESDRDFNSDVLEAVAPLVRGLMIGMAQMGVDGKCWDSLQEGLERLHTIVYGHAFGENEESTAVGKSMKSS